MNKNTNYWLTALVFQSLVLGVSIISDVGWVFAPPRPYATEPIHWLVAFTSTLFFLFLPVSIICTASLHYECWKLLPSGYRKTAPEKAVGFLFIPFYNFYWFFISYPCLASGYYKFGKNNNISEIQEQDELAIAYAILSICNTFFILIPLIRSVTYIAAFVIFVLFYKRIVSYANLVSNMQSKIES
jgi:CBS domain containing-hemolysin-like protein